MSTDHESRGFPAVPPEVCDWPRARRLTQGPVRLIAPEELPAWIIYEDVRLLVIDKPGDVVCHPSKAGPWSSLVGAAREYTGLPTMHLIFRLDRETSGVVVLAKDPVMAESIAASDAATAGRQSVRCHLNRGVEGDHDCGPALGRRRRRVRSS